MIMKSLLKLTWLLAMPMFIVSCGGESDAPSGNAADAKKGSGTYVPPKEDAVAPAPAAEEKHLLQPQRWPPEVANGPNGAATVPIT